MSQVNAFHIFFFHLLLNLSFTLNKFNVIHIILLQEYPSVDTGLSCVYRANGICTLLMALQAMLLTKWKYWCRVRFCPTKISQHKHWLSICSGSLGMFMYFSFSQLLLTVATYYMWIGHVVTVIYLPCFLQFLHD